MKQIKITLSEYKGNIENTVSNIRISDKSDQSSAENVFKGNNIMLFKSKVRK